MTTQQSEAHRDHRAWQSDIVQWQQDMAHWQQEHRSRLAELETAFAANIEALEGHAEAIGGHQRELAEHEHFLAEWTKSGRPGDQAEEAWSEAHRDETRRHAAQCDAHERIKRYHHRTMAKLATVIAALKADI